MRVCQYKPVLLDDGAGAAAAPLAAVGIPYDHHDSWRGALVDLARRQITRKVDSWTQSQYCRYSEEQKSFHDDLLSNRVPIRFSCQHPDRQAVPYAKRCISTLMNS